MAVRTGAGAGTNAGARCRVCGGPLRPGPAGFESRCTSPFCGLWQSSLRPKINQPGPRGVNERVRPAGLEAVRRANNRRIVALLRALVSAPGPRLLDVGCAHGWFLQSARDAGFDPVGIEPDATMAALARGAGHDVRPSFFPDGLAPGERFDVIAFNDVLEHILDLDASLAAAYDHLTPGGLLSVNVPTAEGAAFRIGRLLYQLGVRGPYLRLWQRGLPSPHVWYFTDAALRRCVERHGFVPIAREQLDSISRCGLWSRVRTVGRPGPVSMLTFAGTWLAADVLNRRSANDILLVVFRRGPEPPGSHPRP